MEADQELPDDQLPPGHTPIWIEPPMDANQVQMLNKIKSEDIARQYEDVMVLYERSYDGEAASLCSGMGWKYHWAGSIHGCEAQCVILLDCQLYPEFITRGINMLIIVNNT